MKNTFKTLVIGASMAVGMSAIVAPAHAGGLTGAKIDGTAPYLTYNVSGQNTVQVGNSSVSLQAALQGGTQSPGGNVELFSNSETLNLSQFLNYNQVTTLTGTIGDKSISLSSLTAKDWFGDSISGVSTSLSNLPSADPLTSAQALLKAINPLYDKSNLATQWFNTALSTYGVDANQDMFNTFVLAGGFQRFSDPNISYVSQDDNGAVRIGLAGHEDARTLIKTKLEADRSQLQSGLNTVTGALTTAESARDKLNTALTTARAAVSVATTASRGVVPTIPLLNSQIAILTTSKNAILGNNTTANDSRTRIQTQIDNANNLITAIKATDISLNDSTYLPTKIALAQTGIDSLTVQKNELTSKINLINDGLARLPGKIQASEIVKVAYNGNPAQYLYSFNATGSGLVAQDDGISHSGNYEVSFQGVAPQKLRNPQAVPEPSVMLGLLGVAGVFATQRKSKKVSG